MVQVDARSCTSAAAQELSDFSYHCSYTPPDGDHIYTEGCCCVRCCSIEDCFCCAESAKGLEALQTHGRASGVVSLLECGPACSCTSKCPARTTQRGLAVPVQLSFTETKGWCVAAAQDITQGQFVCQYVGEYITATEARRRLAVYDQDPDRGHALLIARLQLPSQSSSLMCCIDATAQGNIARFINHSCDGGNLEAILVSVRGYLLPRVALFAAQDIPAGQELTYAYCQAAPARSGSEGTAGASRRACHCGTPACTGYMPSAL